MTDEITRLRAELAKANERAATVTAERDALREGLEPFAKAAEDCGVEDDLRIGVVKPADVIWESAAAASITFGHLERARALSRPEPKETVG